MSRKEYNDKQEKQIRMAELLKDLQISPEFKSSDFKKPKIPQKERISTPKRHKKPIESDCNVKLRQTDTTEVQSLREVDMTAYTAPSEPNGTILASVRLSQYDSEPDDSLKPITQRSERLEAVSVLDIDLDDDDVVENSPPVNRTRSQRSLIGSSLGSHRSNKLSTDTSLITANDGKSLARVTTASSLSEGSLEMGLFEVEEEEEGSDLENSAQSVVFGKTIPACPMARVGGETALVIDSQNFTDSGEENYNKTDGEEEQDLKDG